MMVSDNNVVFDLVLLSVEMSLIVDNVLSVCSFTAFLVVDNGNAVIGQFTIVDR